MQKVKLFEQYLNEGLIFSDETTDIFQAMESLSAVLKKENPGSVSYTHLTLPTNREV